VSIWSKGTDLKDQLLSYFVDREFFMRSHGQVRFLKVSATLQRRVAGGFAAIVGAWLIVTLGMAVNQASISFERLALVGKEAKVQSAQERVAKYRDSIDDVTQELKQRQDMIESVSREYLKEVPAAASAAEKVAGDDTVKKISSAIPEAASLARIEQRQIAFAERMTVVADIRSQRAAAAIRKFGLNPENLAGDNAGDNESAQGGPFIPFFGSKEKELTDPRFDKLAIALARMNRMETSLAAIPTSLPAAVMSMTSNYGYRRDPINGSAAMHSGIDFRGAYGTPILAAADGVVSRAAVVSGYGNCVEITHANGLVTRYAHLSGFDVVEGQKVSRGSKIARMGSTGRSTGTHLHFEVRLNGTAVNPMKFLEFNPDVLEVKTASRTNNSTKGS
jgi:murein DD-endopeptidase MepM/ murein hydrolase activator NlpD